MSFSDVSEPQPSLAWTFESSNVDYVTNLTPSSQVSPGPGQLVGSAALVTDAPTSNTAVSFNGSSGYMNLGTSSPAVFDNSTSNLFIECWVYVNATLAKQQYVILRDSASSPGTGDDWGLRYNPYNSGFQFYCYGTSVSTEVSSGTVAIGQWVHVAVSVTNVGNMYLFINGGTPFTASTTGTPRYVSGRTIYIGSPGVVSDWTWSNMYIRDLRVVQGGVVPTTNFTPLASAPFSYASPGYVPNMGSTVFTLLGQFITYVPGKYNQAIRIQNKPGTSSSYVTYPVFLEASKGFSISGWIKTTDVSSSVYRWYIQLWSSNMDVNSHTYKMSWGVAGWNPPNFQIYLDWYGSVGFTPITSGTWFHCTAVVNGSTVLQYVNGNLIGTLTDNLQAGASYNLLGLYSQSDDTNFDDLRIYNTALTAAQVQSVYSRQAMPAPRPEMPQPKLAWTFDSSNVDYVTNLSPFYSTVDSSITNLPTYVSGKYNQAIRLPQTAGSSNGNTYALWTFSSSPVIIDTTGITITCWVNWTTLTAGGTSLVSMYDAFSNVLGIYMSTTATKTGQGFSGTQRLVNANQISVTNSTGTWYHVALVYSPSAVILYRNGVGSTPAVTGSTGGVNITSIRIGSQANNINPSFAGYGPADCTIDDLRIYNTALTSAQVQSIYQAQGMPSRGVAVTSADLLLYAPFNGTTTDSISSVVPALTGSVSYDSVNSKYTQSLVVTNTPGANATNYLEYPKTIDIAVTGLTCAFWVRTGTDVSTYQSILSFRGQAQYQGQIRYEIYNTKFTMTYWNGKSGGGQASAYAYNIGPVLSTNTWYHLAIAIKPNGNISFYVNAVEYAAGQNCGLRDIGPTRSIVNSFFVGTSAVNPNYQNAFSGEFDDLRLYRYALETPAIVSLYNTVSPANFNPPSTSMSGAPLFNQLSQSAASSAVGAFSLRAVNGVSAKAVQVRPVAAFPATGFTSAVTNPGGNQYNQTLTGYAFGGAGVYTSNCSSWAADGNAPRPWKAFDYDTLTWWENNYGVQSGYNGIGAPNSNTYNGSYTTTVSGSSIGGEWLQLGLPTAIVLYSYSMYNRSGFNGNRMPYSWTVAGSNDGATWTTVDVETGITWTSATQTFTTTSTTPYLYFRMIVQVIQSNGAGNPVNIGQWTLNGSNASWNTDFYADERGNLLTAPVVGMSLQNWLGGATGYVTKWYDQSGKGNDAIQNTAANQPIIQRATKGPGYMVNFNGTSQFVTLSADSQFLNGTNITVNAVALRTATKTTQNWFFGTNTPSINYQRFQFGFQSDTIISMNVTSGPTDVTIPAYNASNEPVYYMTGGLIPSRVFYQNDTLGGTNSNTGLMSAPTGYSYSIGNGTQGSVYYYQGNLFELLIFTSALNQAQVTQIYQNQLSYTGS